MLDFLFAAGQFLCAVGLICGLVLTLSHRKRNAAPACEERAAASPQPSEALRATVQLAVLPPERAPLIRVVPISGVPPPRQRQPLGTRGDGAAIRRRSVRAHSQAAKRESAALLMQSKKKPGADGPRAV